MTALLTEVMVQQVQQLGYDAEVRAVVGGGTVIRLYLQDHYRGHLVLRPQCLILYVYDDGQRFYWSDPDCLPQFTARLLERIPL